MDCSWLLNLVSDSALAFDTMMQLPYVGVFAGLLVFIAFIFLARKVLS